MSEESENSKTCLEGTVLIVTQSSSEKPGARQGTAVPRGQAPWCACVRTGVVLVAKTLPELQGVLRAAVKCG